MLISHSQATAFSLFFSDIPHFVRRDIFASAKSLDSFLKILSAIYTPLIYSKFFVIYLTLFGVIFLPVAKVILRLRCSDILFASLTAARQYHSAESRISLRSNRTRR